MKNIILDYIEKHVVQITFNRPEKSNAFNSEFINEFISLLENIDDDSQIRVLLIKGKGKSFCAGADLQWLKQAQNFSKEENFKDSAQLAKLFERLNALKAVTIALVHGKVLGGGIGVVACCDIAIAANNASFSFAEVKLGIIPATIAPYVITAIGERAARRYFLTAETIDADEALRLQLVHQIVTPKKLVTVGYELTQMILENGPQAMIAAKRFIRECVGDDQNIHIRAAELLAELRVSKEAQEGFRAFLDKRKAKWE